MNAPPDFLALLNNGNAPFSRFMGVEIVAAEKSRVEGRLHVSIDLCTIPNTVHGGALMAFADGLGGVGAFLNLPEGMLTTTTESKTNFFRPAPLGTTITGVATPVNIGKTLQVWRTEIFREDGKLAAVVTQTQMNVPGAR